MSTMLIDGVTTEVGDKPVTLLCHKGDVHITPTDQVEIGPEQTLARAGNVTQKEWEDLRNDASFIQLFNIVFPEMSPLPDRITQQGTGVRHVVGMLLLLCEAITATPPRRPFLRYPESFLHPSAQSKLADLIILLSGAGNASSPADAGT
jgi:hypothetical protein